MKINDLVWELQKFQEKYGNVEVLWSDPEGNYYDSLNSVSDFKALGFNEEGYGYPDAVYVDPENYEDLDQDFIDEVSEEEFKNAPVVVVVSP